ncbi:MAG: DNA primase [Coriobacteriaceae bacterium]|nr:DNA primase [Coriobacteriaceae bacterium]
MITDEDRERVRAATDLVALVQETVELKPRGHEFWGCCPFHGEKTPSFHIIPATQVWHCFGCGEGGDVFSYTMKRENLSFPESIRYLADRAGVEIHETGSARPSGSKRGRIIAACEESCSFFHTMLMRGKDGAGRDYCRERGLTGEVCRKYRLGYAPGRGTLVAHLASHGISQREMIDANVAVSRRGGVADRFYERVIFPIFDEQGRCIAFGGRIMGDGQPKYLNTAETPVFHKKRNLYGFNWAKEHIVAKNEAVVVEGYTDAIACWEAGIGNVVATLGTALTEHHVKTLSRFAKRIVYLFDGDAAGQKAAERAIQFVEHGDIDLRCVILPDDMDPNDFVRARGGDELAALIEAAEPLIDFVFRKLDERSDVSTPGGRAKALDEALRLIHPLRQSYMIDSYYMQIADRLGVDAELVRDAAPRVFREVGRSEERARERERAAERAARSKERHPGSDDAADGCIDAVPLDAYGAVAAEPEDAAPVDALAAGTAPGPFGAAVLTDLERRALGCERELLTLLTAFPDAFRAFAERITEIDWVDPRHESIAWAVLATPAGTEAVRVMDAARAVCPEAAALVSAGTIASTSAHPTETNITFLLDTLELYTIRRRMRATQGRLRFDRSLSEEERRSMTIQATQDAARSRELERALEGVADPFRTLGSGG